MMQASHSTKLVIAGLVALLVILGWGMYASIQSRYEQQDARFAEERQQLSGRIEELTGEREDLGGRIADLDRTLEQERAAAGDLASLRERIATSTASLNGRMETLGDR
jgi:uncharacterized protein HemX